MNFLCNYTNGNNGFKSKNDFASKLDPESVRKTSTRISEDIYFQLTFVMIVL